MLASIKQAISSHQGEKFRVKFEAWTMIEQLLSLTFLFAIRLFSKTRLDVQILEYGSVCTAEMPRPCGSQSHTASPLRQHRNNHSAAANPTHSSLYHISTQHINSLSSDKGHHPPQASRSPTLPRLHSSHTNPTNLRNPLLPKPSLTTLAPLDSRKILPNPSISISRSVFRRPLERR
jgi:hypothetical protein